VQAVADALVRSGEVRIAAISVTGQMHGLVAVDGEDAPLGPCLTVRDRRSHSEVADLEKVFGADSLYRITGARLDAAAPAAKLLWFRKHRPELLSRSRWFLAPKDYVRLVMTGVASSEPVDAAGMHLYDLEQESWHAGIVDAVGGRLDQLPPIEPCTNFGGALRESAARELGLPSGTPVLVGAGDDVELLGAGIVENGRAVEHLGTTGSLLIYTSRPTLDPTMRLSIYPHVVPGLWVVGGSTSNAGGALAWAARALNGGDLLPGPTLHRASRSASPPIFIPYLSGERCPVWDPAAMGAFFGLDISHNSTDLAEAVYLGVAFSLRHIAEAAAELGLTPDQIVVSDSSAQDEGWLQLRADVYGVPLGLLAGGDATATGAMMLAAIGLGHYPDGRRPGRALSRQRIAAARGSASN
jgi:xylulokinase